jgi:peptidoglycan/xylan/chitin deacetylase (PgdA/CDA1 family)
MLPIAAPILAFALLTATTAAVASEPCSARPDALGTARILSVDAGSTPRIGRKQFPVTLPLAPHEVVLTFDDGPWPPTTSRVLDALRDECVRATFFVVGNKAAAAPRLVQRAAMAGHTIATHSYSHPLLSRLPLSRAEAEIDHGFAAATRALANAGGNRIAPVFPLSWFRINAGSTWQAGGAWHRRVRRRSLGERLAADDT